MFIIGKCMNAFEAYKIHVCLKNHFWSKYDINRWPNMFENRYKRGMAINIPLRVFESVGNGGMPGMFKMICDKYDLNLAWVEFPYLGTPYELYWNDVNDSRGFHIFDTDIPRP